MEPSASRGLSPQVEFEVSSGSVQLLVNEPSASRALSPHVKLKANS